MYLPEAKVLLDDEDNESLAFTTTSGCEFIFDEASGEVLIFGAHGSEVVLTLTELRQIADIVRSVPELLHLLMSDD